MTVEPIVSPPRASTVAAHALVRAELSARSRYGHVLLLLGAAFMTTLIAALWITESELPLRTHVAFGVLTLMGACWVAYATWVLTSKTVLLGRHRVVAASMGVLFTAVFLIGAALVGAATGHAAARPATVTGGVMLVVAATLFVRARRHVARLLERRQALERQLGR
jgi:hypothetical protein